MFKPVWPGRRQSDVKVSPTELQGVKDRSIDYTVQGNPYSSSSSSVERSRQSEVYLPPASYVWQKTSYLYHSKRPLFRSTRLTLFPHS